MLSKELVFSRPALLRQRLSRKKWRQLIAWDSLMRAKPITFSTFFHPNDRYTWGISTIMLRKLHRWGLLWHSYQAVMNHKSLVSARFPASVIIHRILWDFFLLISSCSTWWHQREPSANIKEKSSFASARDSCEENAKPWASQSRTADYQTVRVSSKLPLKTQTASFHQKKAGCFLYNLPWVRPWWRQHIGWDAFA